ncbi:MAG: hypothetical protein IPP88_05060 [Betaproteobacteria bacterium]|nr:hypothetical protein [Betaproteobacteria bacterium]
MKTANTVLVILLAAVCASCGDRAAPKPEVKVESASEALKNDQRDIAQRFSEQKAAADANFQQDRARADRQQNVDAMAALAQRLGAGIKEAGTTGRSDFAGLIKKVDAIKADANAVAVDDCTGKVRASLLEAVSATVDAFNSFTKETGAASEASTQKLSQAADQLDAIGQELRACRSS